MKSKTWVALYDLHYPKYCKDTFGTLTHFLEENKVAGFIFGGDQFDNEAISHHNKNKPYYRERRSYLKDEEGFESEILTPLEKLLPKNATKVWVTGNHDDWEFQFIEEHPELEGLVNRVQSLKLESRGWEIVELGHTYKLGKLNCIHGEWLTGIGNQGGNFPAKKAVELMSGNVLAGHTHSAQSFTKVSPVEHIQKWMAWIAPIGGKVNAGYLKARPTAWVNGIVIIEVQDDGNFNVFPAIVAKGRFCYGGKVYGGK